MQDAIAKAKILMEALPYIKEYKGKVVVIKYGGNAMIDEDLKQSVANDLALMHYVGLLPVVIHGGGPKISQAMKDAGLEPKFIEGLRVTGKQTMDIVRQVTKSICDDIVGNINKHGQVAKGFSGDLIKAAKKNHQIDLGFVGQVISVDTAILKKALDQGLIPVISSVGIDENGDYYNINADDVAAAVSKALKAEKLIYLTDVNGIYKDKNDEESLISVLNLKTGKELVEDGLKGGMLPKLLSCLEAVKKGVHRCHILNGTIQHALLLEIFTDEGVGTMISRN